jgi:hypothetical protein
MVRHTIRLIPASAGKYNVDHNGSTIVAESDAPVIAAARSLKASGADERDTIAVTGGDCTFVPQTIAAILKPRPAPWKFDRVLEVWTSP